MKAGNSNEMFVDDDTYVSEDGTVGCVSRCRPKRASELPSETTVVGSDGKAKQFERRSKRVSFTELESGGAVTGSLERRSERGDNSPLDVPTEGDVAASEVPRSRTESKIELLFRESSI